MAWASILADAALPGEKPTVELSADNWIAGAEILGGISHREPARLNADTFVGIVVRTDTVGLLMTGTKGSLTDLETIAGEGFAALGTGRQTSPFSGRFPAFDLESSYESGSFGQGHAGKQRQIASGVARLDFLIEPFGQRAASTHRSGDMFTTVRCTTSLRSERRFL
jgi:hypothetical protein